jgi:predicted RNase H-like HicB family nuclease
MARTASRTRKARIPTDRYQYTAVFDPDEKGGYTVTVPALPGLVTEGDTFEEAKAMVEEAIAGYLQALRKHGEPVPTEDSSFVVPVAVTVSR